MRKRRNRTWDAASVAGLLFISCVVATGATWAISQKIPVVTNVVRILPDPHRPWIYAIDRQNSYVLFINLLTGSVQKQIYVGKDPSDCDIDVTGNFLYVPNKGPGTGLPGSWRIGVVALTNQTLVTSYIIPVAAEYVTAGRAGRLYYSGGDAHAVNTDTGADLGGFATVRTRMAIFADKSRLYGQYVYYGNLGQMGVFDVSTDNIQLIAYFGYGGGYGWGYDNYCLSGNDQYLSYGQVLFNSMNLSDQIGAFQEQMYALNYNGSVAFGQTSIWDNTTFPIHGDAAKITDMPFLTTVMAFDKQANVLYAFNNTNSSLYSIEQTTTHGIPFRWLAKYGLGTNDNTEVEDPDNDGSNSLQEWVRDSNPTNPTPVLRLGWLSGPFLTVQESSPARWYELQRRTNLVAGAWLVISQLQGSGSNLVFDVTADRNQRSRAFYRLRPKVY